MIESKISEIEEKDNEVVEIDEDDLENPLNFDPIEVRNAMGEFRQANDSITSDALDEMINNLNSDQQRIFKNVTEKISQNTNVLRHSSVEPEVPPKVSFLIHLSTG